MNALADYYGDNLVLLGFPCNQFGLQEPGVGEEILNAIEYVRPGGGFKTAVTIFEKTQVNGDGEDPIFTFLKSGCEYTDSDYSSGLEYSPLRVGDIHWNFEKFLIGKDGKVAMRYHPRETDAETLKPDIDALLAA